MGYILHIIYDYCVWLCNECDVLHVCNIAFENTGIFSMSYVCYVFLVYYYYSVTGLLFKVLVGGSLNFIQLGLQ